MKFLDRKLHWYNTYLCLREIILHYLGFVGHIYPYVEALQDRNQ